MTVTTTHNTIAYTAGAGATVFPYTFLIVEGDDLVVTKDGVVQSSGYTVSGVGVGSGGNVTFGTPLVGGEVITITRATDITQQVNLLEGSRLPADPTEGMWDKLTLIAQDLDARVDEVESDITNIQVGAMNLIESTRAGLPTPGTSGLLRHVTDDVRGVFMDTGAQWISLAGEVVNAKEFGAVGDGVADDTAALQAAITAALGKTLHLPIGRYRITGTLTIDSDRSIQIRGTNINPNGAATHGTTLDWDGDAVSPLFHLLGLRDAVFEEFGIVATVAMPLLTAFRSETVVARTATKNVFRHLWINGTDGGIGKGIQFIAGSGGDSNNDLCTFHGLTIANYTTAAVSFEHAQSKGHRFMFCSFTGWTATGPGVVGTYGVTTNLGAGNQGGGFTWHAGQMNSHEVDFHLGAANEPILIAGVNIENSLRLLTTAANGVASTGWPVTIMGSRWAGNELHADQRMIDFGARGPLVLIGNTFGSGQAVAKVCRIRFAASGASYVTVIGNYFRTIDASTVNPLELSGSGPHRVLMIGNNYQTAASSTVSSEPTFADHLAVDSHGSFAALAVSPTALTGNQNNYAPSGSGFWRLTSDASRTLTGLAGGTNGRLLLIANVGAQNIVLANQSGSSTAANQIITGTGADYTVLPSETVGLVYDATTARWRVLNRLLSNALLTSPAISAAVLSGTITGTYTLGGTPTIATPTISDPTLSGTVTGTPTWASGQTFPVVKVADGTVSAPGFAFSGDPDTGFVGASTTARFYVAIDGANHIRFSSPGNVVVRSDGSFGWASNTDPSNSATLVLVKDGTDTLAQRRTTNPQASRLYNTWTSASIGEWLESSWASSVATIKPTANGSGTLRALRIVRGAIPAITYSTSMTPDAALGNLQTITVTDGVAFAINAPTNPLTGQELTLTLRNTSGGAAGAATWNAAFKMAAWTNPATANSRSITFVYDGTNWVERARTPADVPN